jgi:membrane protein YqaA with SNARE-associated domain
MTFVEEYGYLGLFLFCMLAATIVPVSSEGVVAGSLLLKLKPFPVLFWATFGNCSGTLLNYFLGWWLGQKWLERKQNRISNRAYILAHKYGWPTLFLSWLPFIGDPLTIIAGILRWNFVVFVIIVFSLRFLRYYLILYLFF